MTSAGYPCGMRIVLAHGASGHAGSMQPWVDGLALRGIRALAIDLPVRRAETAIDAYRRAAGLDRPVDRSAADVPAGEDVPAGQDGPADPQAIIGGHSYGGRVASLLAAADASLPTSPIRGLVLLSYPLHRPGDPAWEARTSHWPDIRVPVLLLSGEADPFARIDLLRRAVAERLPNAELVTWPRLGHTLAPVRDAALDRIAAFRARV